MVAKITVPLGIKRALNYNEQKVKEHVAQCIYAHNFLKDAESLNFYEKLDRFEQLIALNKRASTNVVHISLNFGINEKLNRDTLEEIASVYMQKIGFDEQPYLVYQHLDAGHPHIHIVTTNIQKDGRRISLHNLGKNQSNRARKEIEIAYNLVKAEAQKQQQAPTIKPINAQKVSYGKTPTKRAITNVLDAVLCQYKYSSLAELNALLKLYNIIADKGEPGSRIFDNHGLVYRVLDEKGNKIGVPIKASSIYSKPTLSFLEQKFKENEILKQQDKNHLKSAIDWIFFKPPKSIEGFKKALEKEKISLVVRQNEQGIIYGLTYIDHDTKSVFNGSDIGKQYSAKAVLEKCGISYVMPTQESSSEIHKSFSQKITLNPQKHKEHTKDISKILETIISPSEQQQQIPFELRKRKKKKRRSH